MVLVKSTLASVIAGHPRYTVTSGSITLDNKDVLQMSVDDAREQDLSCYAVPDGITGVSVGNFLRTAKAALDQKQPQIRQWIETVRGAMDGLQIERAFLNAT